MQRQMPPPHDPRTFERAILDWREYDAHAHHRRLYEDLIAMRRADRAFAEQRAGDVDGAVLAPEAFVLHYFAGRPGDERLLCINLGPELIAGSFPEPLLAPPDGHVWQVRWSSEDPEYGGTGTPAITGDRGWTIRGHSAVVLKPAVK
jgi:maltooligosyltrehalose trehalohydrolase